MRSNLLRYINAYVLYPLLEKLAKRKIRPKLKILGAFEMLDNDEQLEKQKNDLYKLLHYCQENIPYYQLLFKKFNFDIEQVKNNINYIQQLPVMTKQTVRENLHTLRVATAIHPRKTGGSTGQSAWFFYDNNGLDWTSAINLYAYNSTGKKRHHIDCHFSSEIGLQSPLIKDRIKDFLKRTSLNRKVLMISSFSNIKMANAYKKLRSFQPYLIQGHPSTMYAIACYIENQKINIIPLCKVFEPSGEMISQKMVDKIENFTGCKIVNRYGNAEFGVVAHSNMHDSFNKLKIYRKAFYVEPCVKNNLIITNLTNYGMPLLRYDTGDIGTVREEVNGSYIYDIQGRIHDTVTINENVIPTHFIMDFLDHIVGNIREFQIITQDDQLPCLNIIAENNEDQDRIKQAILKKWQVGLEINFIGFDQLKYTGWRQKFRHIIHLESQA